MPAADLFDWADSLPPWHPRQIVPGPVPALHGALSLMPLGRRPDGTQPQKLAWYWFDGHPDRRIWVCLDPWDTTGINDSDEPPAVNEFGRLVDLAD